MAELKSRAGAVLHPVEVDLLCTFAEVGAPFPLEVPSAGQTEEERAVLFHGAAMQLMERDLADDEGPLDVAEEFVYLLRSCTGVVDLLLATEKQTLGAVVLAYKDEALLVTQDFEDPAGLVRMKAATLDEAVDALARLIPKVEAPLTAPFSLPRRALENAFEIMLSRLPDPADEHGETRPMTQPEIEELLRSHGIDDRVSRRMVSHLQPVLGNGQVGVARRTDTEDQWERAGEELRWLDTARGRYRLASGTGEDADWMSVNPLPLDEIRTALRQLAATARR